MKTETLEGNKLIAEFMGFPKPDVGQKWDYDRSLDQSIPSTGLTIRSVTDKEVRFEQVMAYAVYGIEYFDGRIFKPTSQKDSDHAPCRPYNTSWDWLMPVVEKIFNMPCNDRNGVREAQQMYLHPDEVGLDSPIEAVYKAVIQFIQWYNLTEH